MAEFRHFDELDFFSDDEDDLNIPDDPWLSDLEENDGEEVVIPLEKAEDVEIPEDFELPPRAPEVNNNHESLFDALLGEALSGELVEPAQNPRVEGLFDDLTDSEDELIPRSVLEEFDSGIGFSESEQLSAQSSASSESTSFDFSKIEQFLEYMKEEENAVPIDSVPDFASKKNVYGTSFNVSTGAMSRPPRFEFARRDARWIDSCKLLTYDNSRPLYQLLALGKPESSVKLGAVLKLDTKFTNVHEKSAAEMEAMETRDLQEIIRDAFNARRLAVILLGVEGGVVSGCRMSAGKQDMMRLALDTAVQTEFVPPVENVLDAIDIQFVPVEDVVEMFLIVIRVKQLRNRIYHLASDNKMPPPSVTIRYGTSLMPFFAKGIPALPPSESDITTATIFTTSSESSPRCAESPETLKLKRPSLSAILSAISDNKALYIWQKAQISEMGLGPFKSMMFERMRLGTLSHSQVEKMLKIRAKNPENHGENEQEVMKLISAEQHASVRNYMKSALPIISEIQSPELAICEQKIRHPKLAYQGRFDAVVKYKDHWCMLDWKTAPPRSSFSKQGEDSLSYTSYVRQLSAYAAAFNHDVHFENLPIVKQGLLVSLREDGAPADVFHIQEKEMKASFEDTKEKLLKFWKTIGAASSSNVDFAYKPDI